MPPPTTDSRSHCRPCGSRWRVRASAPTARIAATTARPDPMNSGDRPPTATRVNGMVNEKATTPSRPHSRPATGVVDSAVGRGRVALLFWLMNHDSSSRIAEALRTWIATAAPGARLPSTRALVEQHRASPVTVQTALRDLTTQGLIESRPGVGTFVRAVRTARPSDYGWQTAALRAPRARIQAVSTAHAQCAERRDRAARRLPGSRAAARAAGALGPDASGAQRLGAVAAAGRRSARPAVVVRAGARRADAAGRHATDSERRDRAAREPERAELDLPGAGDRRPAAPAGVADVLGSDRRGRAGRRPGGARPDEPRGPRPRRGGAGVRRDRRARCSTRSRPTRTPPERSGRRTAPSGSSRPSAITAPS